MKTTLLAGILFFMFIIDLHAQDKYDYALISYRTNYKFMEVSINGESYERIEVKESTVSTFTMDMQGLKQVKTMNNEGWELFDTNVTFMTSFNVYSYYLRRKIN